MSGLDIRTHKLGAGAVEVAVRNNGELVAVITHPFTGAPWWFLHRVGEYSRGEKFKTKKAALTALGVS